MKFRTKPKVIEAEQYFTGKPVNGVRGCDPNKLCGCVVSNGDLASKPHVHTAHDGQIVVIEDGDYIIPEPNGKGFYPCKPEIFEDKYEAAI